MTRASLLFVFIAVLFLLAFGATAAAPARPNPLPAMAAAPAIHAVEGEAPAPQVDPIVYITNTGTKYHRKGCQHLRASAYAVKLSEAKARGYTPCLHCKPPQ